MPLLLVLLFIIKDDSYTLIVASICAIAIRHLLIASFLANGSLDIAGALSFILGVNCGGGLPAVTATLQLPPEARRRGEDAEATTYSSEAGVTQDRFVLFRGERFETGGDGRPSIFCLVGRGAGGDRETGVA